MNQWIVVLMVMGNSLYKNHVLANKSLFKAVTLCSDAHGTCTCCHCLSRAIARRIKGRSGGHRQYSGSAGFRVSRGLGVYSVTEVTRISVQPLYFKSHSYGTVQPKIQRIRNYEKCRNQYKITNTSKKTEKRTNGVWLKFTLTVSWLNVKTSELFLSLDR